ncbi:nucleotidyltransferase family protein [Alteromonas sp. 14N.309.X.WAT.G.H12]|uniref:nucleotidyltransferase family protein n=1 Tax=Alteromonas sp. 14N.309.X.WAT.G.H12 TaxID=3120824 RepID=UPI002FD2B0C9
MDRRKDNLFKAIRFCREPESKLLDNAFIDYLSITTRWSADFYKISPVLAFHLLRLPESKLPVSLRKNFKKIVFDAVASQKMREQALEMVASYLNEENIPIILLKGMAFNNNLYPVNYPRFCSDIDILIESKFRAKANKILGERMQIFEPSRKRKFHGLYEDTYLFNNRLYPHVDLHYYLAHPDLFTVDEKKLWLDSKVHPYYHNENVRVLSSEHMILHNVIHSTKDLSFFSYNLLDTITIFDNRTIDTSSLYLDAVNWNIASGLAYLIENLEDIRPDIDCFNMPVYKIKSYLSFLLKISEKSLSDNLFLNKFYQQMGRYLLTDSSSIYLKHMLHYFSK